eukprot:3699183-Amphidinium_carterae.1
MVYEELVRNLFLEFYELLPSVLPHLALMLQEIEGDGALSVFKCHGDFKRCAGGYPGLVHCQCIGVLSL